ncbi:MAG: hypothetical protein GX851_00100 [Clostridiales bacterium]|nr:hypothetical protein [Clostridiales bacterium]
MAYIRDKSQELTGYQAGEAFFGKIDLQCDFVMAYRLNNTIEQRVESFKDEGYVVHMMTGIAWGAYTDYLNGEYDGINHWDEGQTDRAGNMIMHGKDTPYMVPTVSFADYLTEKLKRVVDAGVEAIHVEEPEFWDRAGYSEAFKREYLLYYKQPWQPPHTSADTRCKCAKLKAYLYKRTIERVSSALKEYALTKYNRVLRFYVPTHSLINYTQWKIMSPEGSLAPVPSVDGFIAQVWTGTSREKNCYEGIIKERTFETSYLEYGVMQELVKCTDKRMWFLHDPIEDNPAYDWNDYRYNYLKTVTASLLHPRINRYEICPWPNRVFEGKYPKDSPDAEPIPAAYSTLLNNVFQALGDMECSEPENEIRTGILISDTALYQRDYPDTVLPVGEVRTGTVLSDEKETLKRYTDELFKGRGSKELMLEFIKSNALPSFYGLCLPLLKHGMPVRPVLLDNANRYAGYLDDCDVCVLSYEFMKPDYPNINNALASWVKQGGILIYIGDGSDPYHCIDAWWSKDYPSPAEHLFKMLEIEPDSEKSVFSVGSGIAAVWKKAPAELCFSKENAEKYRRFFKSVTAEKGFEWNCKNHIIQKRGAYIAAAVFDESISDEPLVLDGLFADMYTESFAVTGKKLVKPDENVLLFDLSAIENERLRIIGTSVRVLDAAYDDEKVTLRVHGASDLNAYIRLRTPFPVKNARARLSDGTAADITAEYDATSRTVLLNFRSTARDIEIIIFKEALL